MGYQNIIGCALVAAATILPAQSGAQDAYPNKPIRLLIPFTPGGGTDFVSRIVATALSESLKTQVVPENRPGASGNLAIAQAAKAAPDGYTIVMGQSDNMALGPHLYLASAREDLVGNVRRAIAEGLRALAPPAP